MISLKGINRVMADDLADDPADDRRGRARPS
jgi:hypothetical protein